MERGSLELPVIVIFFLFDFVVFWYRGWCPRDVIFFVGGGIVILVISFFSFFNF